MARALRIGLAGLGVVGTEVAKLILSEQKLLSAQAGRPIVVTACSARDPHKPRGIDLSALAWETDAAALVARDDVDILVELMGGADGAALKAVSAALEAGKPVVTANKAMLAKHWQKLFALSRKHHAAIMFEASVCAGIPVIKVLREGLAGNRISAVSGILNGTCNYILSSMETRDMAFDDALREAQKLGYAEADPTLDIDGLDTAHKLIVLAKLAFDPAASLESIPVTGIRAITLDDVRAARAQKQVIRLVASARRVGDHGVEMNVGPQVLDMTHPLAHVAGPMNAITIEAQPVQSCTLIGPGAGAGPTASAVLADIIDLARFDIVLEGPLYLPR